MSLHIQEIASQNKWDALAHEHWVHTWEYGEIQQQLGRTVLRIACYDDEKQLRACAQFIVYPLGYRQAIAYAPYGPVVYDKQSKEVVQAIGDYMYSYATQNNLLAVRMELDSEQSYEKIRSLPLWAYRTSFHQARGEALLSLDKSSEELWSNLSKSTKRNINKANKHNLDIQYAYGQHMLDWCEEFILLNEANTKAHNTTTHTASYFSSLFEILSKNPNNFVAVVSQNDIVHAINIITVFGSQAYCPFGASSKQGKTSLGAYYFIKWEIITQLQKQHIESFNWGGISVGIADEQLKGLNQFKLGFGAKAITHKDLIDLVTSWKYWLYMIYTYIRKK